MSTVVLSVYKVANFTDGGGHFWVYMQYAQGLRRLGCDVYWLEQLRPVTDPDREEQLRATFLRRMKRFGFEGKVLLYTLDRRPDGIGGAARFLGWTEARARAVLRSADLLLNFHYAIDPGLLASFRRTALVDIDPGLLQFWMATGQLPVPRHDRYLTTGETVGTPDARFPDCGVAWTRIRPPVCLELWPRVREPGSRAFTTVSSWASSSFLEVNEGGVKKLVDNTKRAAFLEFAELPRHTRVPLELALFLVDGHPDGEGRPEQVRQDAMDRAWLERNGWRVRDSHEVAGGPEAYRAYIQSSRGEFSCAKWSCMAFQNAWVSDRTICYLASGKPVVVQHTGPSAYLPDDEGMFRFQSMSEAVEALERIRTDYDRHCRAARGIAEAYFDARPILTAALEAALGPPPTVRPLHPPALIRDVP